MKPYYILNVLEFDKKLENYSTQQQLGLNNVKNDNPKTTFKKSKDQLLDGFIKYDFTSEINKKAKGRAYGTDEIFNSYILIKDDRFYYSSRNNLLILATNKETFNKFFEHMKDGEKFKFEKLEMNFEEIIKNEKVLDIESIWVGEIPQETNIDILSFHGSKVEDSNRCEEIIKEGAKIKNLSLIYNHNGNQEKIMITKHGGIIAYEDIAESDALVLIEDVFKNLLVFN